MCGQVFSLLFLRPAYFFFKLSWHAKWAMTRWVVGKWVSKYNSSQFVLLRRLIGCFSLQLLYYPGFCLSACLHTHSLFLFLALFLSCVVTSFSFPGRSPEFMTWIIARVLGNYFSFSLFASTYSEQKQRHFGATISPDRVSLSLSLILFLLCFLLFPLLASSQFPSFIKRIRHEQSRDRLIQTSRKRRQGKRKKEGKVPSLFSLLLSSPPRDTCLDDLKTILIWRVIVKLIASREVEEEVYVCGCSVWLLCPSSGNYGNSLSVAQDFEKRRAGRWLADRLTDHQIDWSEEEWGEGQDPIKCDCGAEWRRKIWRRWKTWNWWWWEKKGKRERESEWETTWYADELP